MVQRSRRRVAFSETDASGRVHFTVLLKWIEDAEHMLLASLGFAICSSERGWPRVSVSCDYRLPFIMGEEGFCELWLTKIGQSSLHWSFRILKENELLAAEGSMVTVAMEENGPRHLSAEEHQRLASFYKS